MNDDEERMNDSDMEDEEAVARLELLQQRHEDGPVRFGEIELGAAGNIKQAGIEAGNILIGSKGADVIISDTAREAREKQERLIQVFEEKRRMGQVVVPTDHARVKQVLRKLGEPITLFGEREAERRDRLKRLLAQLTDAQVTAITGQLDLMEVLTSTTQVQQTETFYTEGSLAVREARHWIAQYSLNRAKARVQRQREDKQNVPWPVEQSRRSSVLEGMGRAALEASEVADERPVSCCSFTADGANLVTGGWTGTVKVWSTQGPQKVLTVKAHEERITGVAPFPHPHPAGPLPPPAQGDAGHMEVDEGPSSSSSSQPLFATASADRTARLWSRSGQCLATLGGHDDRLARLAFHPSGRFLATASFDQTWRLWDIERTASVLQQTPHPASSPAPPPSLRPTTEGSLYEQEGHSRSVYAVACHCDGSLLASGGLDAIGRVWDLRTGRSIVTLQGHVKPILALDFAPDGFHVVTGSADNSCQVWDLRQAKCIYTIPAHSSLVSSVKYRPGTGDYIVTAGYDNTAKVWSTADYKLVRVLAGHDNKVMSVDVHPSKDLVLTSSYDKTVKLWQAQ